MPNPLPPAESLTIEFKSDTKPLPDSDLTLACVCMANGLGGKLYLGVEDCGSPTGLHAKRNVAGITAIVAQRTQPALIVMVTIEQHAGHGIAIIDVPRKAAPVATSKGQVVRRALDAKGRPVCLPFFPADYSSHQAQRGRLDPSSQPVPGSILAELDPAARSRLKRLVDANPSSDKSLVGLEDDELDSALGLVTEVDGVRVPTFTGLLLIGRETALRARVPNHEVAFQILEGTDVRANTIRSAPLVDLLPWVEERIEARNDQQEITLGLFRIGVPRVDPEAFREALVNAVSHRDYHQIGAVHITWQDDDLTLSSPGGLVEGVTIDRLLTVMPTPRNRALTDALKRIGLAERTGRGVDRIFRGLVRYGRPGLTTPRPMPPGSWCACEPMGPTATCCVGSSSRRVPTVSYRCRPC